MMQQRRPEAQRPVGAVMSSRDAQLQPGCTKQYLCSALWVRMLKCIPSRS